MSHSVFVSSTFVDLSEHRSTVQSAIRQLGAVDISMENFGARDERPKAECLRIIGEEVDSFVGIYAHRYGFIPKGDKKSIIEAEYDAAIQNNLPMFIYLVNEDALWNPSFVDDGTNKKKLRQFKQRVNDAHICKRFSNKDDLATSVAADIGRYLLRSALVRVSDSGPSRSQDKASAETLSPADWNKHRVGRYVSSRDIFLVHSLAPSKDPGQLFDIFVYLQRHKNRSGWPSWAEGLSDVRFADFFLGPVWENRIFHVSNDGNLIGIAVSAYGEFLCVCRVTFDDGSEVFLDRYINFSEYARADD